MTDNEIVRALEKEIRLTKYVDSDYANVKLEIIESALDLINRQQAESERLQNDLNVWKDIAIRETTYVSIAKNEAIKEFAERLKELYTDESITDDMQVSIRVIKQNIGDIAEEMVGDTE